ncbi:MAG: DUF177 domain-containing protein [Eubacteriales bacterium]|nr:DUF177 domain-containing protein [Eubacteriales bacterium]
MLIDITSISHGMGDYLSLEWTARPDELNLDTQDDAEYSAISFTGRLENSGKNQYILSGEVSAVSTTPCARCLMPVTNPLSIQVREPYSPGSLESNTGLDAEGYRYEGHVINIRQALHDNLLLASPPKLICQTDCQGLCPTCGQNLNLGHCKCADDHPSPVSPFDQLKTLL